MSNKRVLIVDDREKFPSVPDELSHLVETRATLGAVDDVDAHKYATAFVHSRNNNAVEWSDDALYEGTFSCRFEFSGSEDRVIEHKDVYTLPRGLYVKQFTAFVQAFADGAPLEECAKAFSPEAFEAASAQEDIPSASQSAASTTERLPVATPVHPGERVPDWCDQDLAWPEGEHLQVQFDSLSDEPHIIVLQASYSDEGDRLDAALRFRLNTDQPISRYPIAIQLDGSFESWVRYDSDYSFLASKGTQLFKHEQELQDFIDSAPGLLSEEELLDVFEEHPIRPKGLTGRHDLANAWGPIQLWNGVRRLMNADMGLPEWTRTLFFELTERRYYQYLFGLADLRQAAHPEQNKAWQDEVQQEHQSWVNMLERRQQPLRVGLVDDNGANGWKSALEGIFADTPDAGSVEAPYERSDFQNIDALADDIAQHNWDIICVDLRLTESDAQTTSRRAEKLSGTRLVRKLKQIDPSVPVVAFTASNKAWTVQELYEAGADGYWVKESPEYGTDPAYTVQNAAALMQTLREVVQRYADAAPVWELIKQVQAIRRDPKSVFKFIPLVRDKDQQRIEDEDEQRVRNYLTSIENRLRRSFGHLVIRPSAHEETAFAFHRKDRAFLALWGIINDINELYFSGPKHEGSKLHQIEGVRQYQFYDPQVRDTKEYWCIENGNIVSAEPAISNRNLARLIRPTDRHGRPERPNKNIANPRMQWLLFRAMRPDLAKRMHAYDGSSLRELRNHLADIHGETDTVKHATLNDIHDITRIWNVILGSV